MAGQLGQCLPQLLAGGLPCILLVFDYRLQQLGSLLITSSLRCLAPGFKRPDQHICITDSAELLLGLLEAVIQVCRCSMARIKNGQQGQQLAAIDSGLMNILIVELFASILAVVLKIDVQLAHGLFPLPEFA